MKKMVIIDVPEDCNSDVWCVDGDLMYKNENGYWIIDHEIVEVKLMPLPMKRHTQVNWSAYEGKGLTSWEETDFDKGWNACVDYLEGDMQDD